MSPGVLLRIGRTISAEEKERCHAEAKPALSISKGSIGGQRPLRSHFDGAQCDTHFYNSESKVSAGVLLLNGRTPLFPHKSRYGLNSFATFARLFPLVMFTSFRRPDAPPLNYKTDAELRYIIDNRENYLPESVLGAMTELKSRGTQFSDEEVRVVEEDMQARMEIAANAAQSTSFFADGGTDLQVEDPDAYVFYSRRVIKAFSFFSLFFGCILMAMNLAKTKNYAGVMRVILFGLGISFLENYLVLSGIVPGSAGIIIMVINSFLIDLLFWNQYIGKATLYKARPFWIPLIIGLALIAFTVTAIYTGQIKMQLPTK